MYPNCPPQKEWLKIIATCARGAVTEGHFRKGLDPEQFAHDLNGVILAYHHAARLLRASDAEARARVAFANLLRLATSQKGSSHPRRPLDSRAAQVAPARGARKTARKGRAARAAASRLD